MGELRSKKGGYYILNAKIGNTTIKKAFRNSDIPFEDVDKKPSTDEFYLNIPDQPIKADRE